MKLTPVSLCLCALVASAVAFPARAAVTDLRAHFVSRGFGPQSETDQWTIRHGGANGALLSSAGTYFAGPYQHATPIFGPILNIGDYAGWGHGATFDGIFIHSGPGVPLVATFRADELTVLSGFNVRAEMVLNGISSNGMGFEVVTDIGGVLQSRGTGQWAYALTASEMPVDFGGETTLAVGDKVHVIFNDLGSFLYDHGNINLVPLVVPAPGVGLVAGGMLAAAWRRRRR